MAKDEIDITPFSIRVLTLDTALRFAFFCKEEAEKSLGELSSRELETREAGRQRAIRLFRQIRAKEISYERIKGSFDDPDKEKLFLNTLKRLRKNSSIFLTQIKSAWDVKPARRILRRIIALQEYIDEILAGLKKQTPRRGKYFYGGVDAGATKTKAVISDKNGGIIGQAEAGPSEMSLYGAIGSFQSLIAALKKATENAGLNFETTYFRRCCVGTAGILPQSNFVRQNELMHRYITQFHTNIADVIIIDDSLLAWYGALGGKPGIMVIGGTGHIAYGYNEGKDAITTMQGIAKDWRKFIHLGGRHLAYHSAVRISERLEKRIETKMVRAWRVAFKQGEIFSKFSNLPFTKAIAMVKDSMYKRTAALDDKDIASMASLVLRCAKEGDRDAMPIVRKASENAAIYIRDVAEKIGLHNQEFQVAYVGSVIRHPFALSHLEEVLPEYEPYAELVRPKFEPEIAAIEIARKNIHFY